VASSFPIPGGIGIHYTLNLKLGRFINTKNNISSENKLAFLTSFSSLTRDAEKSARLGESAPNPFVYDVRTSKKFRLLDPEVLDQSKPIVLNFGSCTWPPFMANLVKVKKVRSHFFPQPPTANVSFGHCANLPRWLSSNRFYFKSIFCLSGNIGIVINCNRYFLSSNCAKAD